MGYLTAALAIYGAADSYSKSQKAEKSINALKKVKPKFRDALTIQREAEAGVKNGFTPEEAANFQSGLTRTNNAQYRRATDMNPNLAPAIQAGINYGNVAAQNQFAAADAQLRQSKVDRLTNQITGQSNAQTEADIQNKRDQEIAYGNAKNQNDAQLYNSLSMLAASTQNMDFNSTGAKTTGQPLSTEAIPSMGAQNVPNNLTPVPGTNDWAQNLYGNPNAVPAYPLMGRAPSAFMPPAKRFNNTFQGYYY
jgi:hypothetical protein